jgi:NAD(P)-dependent dehydrogenase (short-subunit alcohol dehydrogenase family)
MHSGRLVLVTGAASGIGRATALRFAREGAQIALFDRSPTVEQTAATIVQAGGDARSCIVDIADAKAVDAAVAEVSSSFGAIACLVNGAAIVDNIAPLQLMKPEAWSREIGVNLGGPFNLIRAVAPGMAERRWGRIVNISSAAARGRSGIAGRLFGEQGEAARPDPQCGAGVRPLWSDLQRRASRPCGNRRCWRCRPDLEAGIAATPARASARLMSCGVGLVPVRSRRRLYQWCRYRHFRWSHLNTLVLGSQKANRDIN